MFKFISIAARPLKRAALAAVSLLLAVSLCACTALAPEPADVPEAPAQPEQTAPDEPAAVEGENEPQVTAAVEPLWLELDASAPFEYDLDQDGTPETIEVTVDEEAYTTTVKIDDYTDVLGLAFYKPICHAADTDMSDGYIELYVSGNAGSDDFESFIYRMTPDGIKRVDLPWGNSTDVDGMGTIGLEVVVNVLGTYGAFCRYALDADMNLTRITPYSVDTDRVLTVQQDGLKGETLPDGTPVDIPKGTELTLSYTDAESYVVLESAEGELYKLFAEYNGMGGWIIQEQDEVAWFGMLHYAG